MENVFSNPYSALSPVQVIKGCSNGRFSHGTLFGRFDCDFRDVCSRVERLIMDGYIKRDIGHPHVLVYVPDPSELIKVSHTITAVYMKI